MINCALREQSRGKGTLKMIRFPAMNKKTNDMSRATLKWSKQLQAAARISFKEGQEIPLNTWFTTCKRWQFKKEAKLT